MYNASIPILTMEVGTYNEFSLGIASGLTETVTDTNILNILHFITSGLNLGPYLIYDSSSYIKSLALYNAKPSGCQIIELIRPDTTKSTKYLRSLVTLDKGMYDWNLRPASERRAFWGTTDGVKLSEKGWALWNKTLQWILYDDIDGNATIIVNATDQNNCGISNAIVTLLDVNNTLNIWNQKTNYNGLVNFTNIPWGTYNITVEYETEIKETLSNLEIAPDRTYQRTANFFFQIQLPIIIEEIPPTLVNIEFYNISSGTFYVDIFDDSPIVSVYLNFTVKNNLTSEIISNSKLHMVQYSGNTYYNDTLLDSLENNTNNLILYYNITATDIGGNRNSTETKSIYLGDISPPIIHSFNLLDYGNGYLEFFANITDESGIIDPVLLNINNSKIVEMHLNSSGYWVCQTNYFYNDFFNFTIFSVIDLFGHENGYNIDKDFPWVTHTVIDETSPQIWGLIPLTLELHDEGLVEFTVYVNDWNIYQSGLNDSTVELFLEINEAIMTQIMVKIGSITFFSGFTFSLHDNVTYWISAKDLAGNIREGEHHGPFIIDDNSIPQVSSFGAKEFGNGTIFFNATVIDWPYNDIFVYVNYSQQVGEWVSVQMIKNDTNLYYRFVTSLDYRYKEVTYYIIAIDNTGNKFLPSQDQFKNIILTDLIPPQVEIKIENSTINDGEITILSSAIDPYGISFFVNNSFYLELTVNGEISYYIMEYYSYYSYVSTHSLKYGDRVNITIWVSDDDGNIGFSSRYITIDDFAPPKIIIWGVNEYQNGTVTIWAIIEESSNGSGLPSDYSSIFLEYIFTALNQETMKRNDTDNCFVYSISGFQPGNTFAFRICASDNNNNVFTTNWNPVSIIDKTTPICEACGYIDEPMGSSDTTKTKLTFWAIASDYFGEIKGINLTLKYILINSIKIESGQMIFNGSMYIFITELVYNTRFNYTIRIYDKAFNEIDIVNYNKVTYWGPVIYEVGIKQLENSYDILIWGNVSDWGSGIANVFLEYKFNNNSQLAGHGSDIMNSIVLMNYNETLYVVKLSLKSNGILEWRIIANSTDNYFSVTNSIIMNKFNVLSIRPIDFSPNTIFMSVTGTILIIGLLIISVSIYQRQIRKKRKILSEIKEKLSLIPNVYTIFVTTHVGIPILNVMNAMYIKENSLAELISGISVSIDTFLESFQNDFVQEILEENLQDTSSNQSFSIRSSVIEQNKVQILIIASPNFRIFVFLKVKPPKFVRRKFIDAITDLQKNLSYIDPGIINERIVEPQTKAIIKKYFPIDLLTPFIIDVARLKKLESELNKGSVIPISKTVINALKRLIVIKTGSNININDIYLQLQIFEDSYKKGLYQQGQTMFYKEVLDILSKILKLSPHHIYEALWISSMPQVNIIVHRE